MQIKKTKNESTKAFFYTVAFYILIKTKFGIKCKKNLLPIFISPQSGIYLIIAAAYHIPATIIAYLLTYRNMSIACQNMFIAYQIMSIAYQNTSIA